MAGSVCRLRAKHDGVAERVEAADQALGLTDAALLGHAARGVTQRYAHIDEAVRMAADRVSAEIARLLDGAQPRAERRSFKRMLSDMAEIGVRYIENGEPSSPQPVR